MAYQLLYTGFIDIYLHPKWVVGGFSAHFDLFWARFGGNFGYGSIPFVKKRRKA